MPKRKIFLPVAVAVLFCFQLSVSSAAAKEKEITIGLMTELSGHFAANGADCKQGYELARRLYAPDGVVGKYRVRFIYGDTRGEARAGVSEFKRITELEKAYVVIANRSQVGMAINPLSKRKRIPLFGIVGHSEFVATNPFAIRFWSNADQEGKALARKVWELGKKKLAVVTMEDEYTLSIRESLVAEYQKLGGKIVADETVVSAQPDYSSEVTKLKQGNSDAIIVNLGIGTAGSMVRKIRELGLEQQLFSSFWIRKRGEIEAAGKGAVEGTIFVELDIDKPRFREKLLEIYGSDQATSITYTCYSGLATALQVLSENEQIGNREAFLQAVLNTEAVRLLDGEVPIRDREAQFDLQYKAIRNGKIETL